MNLIPFGLRNGRLVEVHEVPRGLKCGCVCPDPACGRPLVARKGSSGKVVWYFAHLGETNGRAAVCGGNESGLHRFVKEYLCGDEGRGKVFPLPNRNSPQLYSGYKGEIWIHRATQEQPIPGTTRRCDVIIDGFIRRVYRRPKGQPEQTGEWEWGRHLKVVVEVNVTNPKMSDYIREVTEAGQLSVVELTITPEEVQKKMQGEYRSLSASEAVKQLVMGKSTNRKWLYRRE